MHFFNIPSIFVILNLVGVEFSVSAFINPTAWRLESGAQLKMLSRLAVVFGRVMPIWYPACALLFAIETWLHWYTSGRWALVAASAIWLLASLASILFLVPLNSRIAEGAADWQRIHRIWDSRHRVRIVALSIAAVVLASVLVR